MFYTKIDLPTSDHKLRYESSILSIGSCFSENIGLKLQNAYFDIDINPFGVQFNPISIKQCICALVDKKQFTATDLTQTGSLWGSLAHSTLFSDVDVDNTLVKINTRAESASKKIREAQTLIITFGTAWIYTHNATNSVVANCHKIASNEFTRSRLTVPEIVEQYTNLLNNLKTINPTLHIIFTVSPVRHIKDGATENNISKGILLQAIQEIVRTDPKTHYFPSYELMVDELRDYRYYADDMLHPSEIAINHLFTKFSEVFFGSETANAYNAICQYNSTKNHRPIHPNTTEHQLLTYNLQLKKKELLEKYPFLKKSFE